MDSMVRAAIAGQFGAAVDMLRAAIEQCPDTLWNDRSEGPPFWQIAYHTLFCLDMYSSPSLKAFKPVAFHVKDANFLAGEYPWLDPPRTIGHPPVVFSKADVLSYLQQCREHCFATLEAMTAERAAERCGFEWYDLSAGELLLLNLRHVQHHAGQLAITLRRRAGIGVDWIGSASLHDTPEPQPARDHT
jgi:DinB superfamily